jgi:hypothetical protein
MPEKTRRITARDVPNILETLDGCDDEAKQEALRDLCPCRNRRYDKEVWAAIYDAYETGDAAIRDQAGHAIETLQGRIPTDPRSQELARWLANEVPAAAGLALRIPVWNPKPTFALGKNVKPLAVPHFQRTHRSRKNKRR